MIILAFGNNEEESILGKNNRLENLFNYWGSFSLGF